MVDVDFETGGFEHEHLSIFQDPETGVTGVIAIHSTALGPAMGGLRLHRYPGLGDAVQDALKLSRAMSFKNAAAGLDLGGGKAVLIDDGGWGVDRPARMQAVGRAIEALQGRYITAEDVGTTPADMDSIATATRYVAGRSLAHGGRGNPAPFTESTVLAAIAAAVRVRLGSPGLAGVRVGVQGVGQVGERLVASLVAGGARVSVTDVDAARASAVGAAHGVDVLPSEGFVEGDFDVFAPCGLGGVIDDVAADRMQAVVVAGAANNPLAGPDVARTLAMRDVLYVPDFVANCGGIISVGAEALGLPEAELDHLLAAALGRVERLLTESRQEGRLPLELAEEWALSRMRGRRSASSLSGMGIR